MFEIFKFNVYYVLYSGFVSVSMAMKRIGIDSNKQPKWLIFAVLAVMFAFSVSANAERIVIEPCALQSLEKDICTGVEDLKKPHLIYSVVV